MVTWATFEEQAPHMAGAVRQLLYQFGVGLGFLATIRADGGPRVHPVSPVLFERGLFVSLVPSPKREDLLRDGRYALHSFPAEDNEDAAYVAGAAAPVHDPELREAVYATYLREHPIDREAAGLDRQLVFECAVGACLVTRTTGHGDPDPRHEVWRS